MGLAFLFDSNFIHPTLLLLPPIAGEAAANGKSVAAAGAQQPGGPVPTAGSEGGKGSTTRARRLSYVTADANGVAQVGCQGVGLGLIFHRTCPSPNKMPCPNSAGG
jgi:hypothetical protein